MKVSSLVIITGLLLMAAPELASASQEDYVRGFVDGARYVDQRGLENHANRVKSAENGEKYKLAAVDAYNRIPK